MDLAFLRTKGFSVVDWDGCEFNEIGGSTQQPEHYTNFCLPLYRLLDLLYAAICTLSIDQPISPRYIYFL
jgi:hypothetical protein